MKNRLAKLLLAVASLVAFGGAAQAAGNAGPFGLEVGVSSLAQTQATVGLKTSLVDAGTNRYSDGPMLKGDGKELGLDGLRGVLFIFDTKNILAAVQMTLPKHQFRPMASQLASKYKVASKLVPHVGDSHVHYTAGSSRVELDAPHMSFEMTLSYMTNSLRTTFQQRRAQERSQETSDQTSKL